MRRVSVRIYCGVMPDRDELVPSGTVAFLFSDVVGSTRLWATDPQGMAASLRRHDEVFRSRALEHGGYVFSTAGDSFAVAFGRATSAAACAGAVLSDFATLAWAGGPPLTVRLGLHLGESEERDGNYFGPTVNLAARVMAAAHGGQCLVTGAVAEALSTETLDLGEHRLRDIEAPVHLLQLGAGHFPPLWTATTGIVSLPSPRTSLIGREDDVATVRRLLAEHRLVTLTGVGGCGKTRLAIEVARREVPAFPQGVWFIDLSTIADDDAIYSVFASTLGVVIADRTAAVPGLTAYLAPRDCLLVIDNCEHVIDEVAEFVDHLLARCPGVRIVATSRESLEVDGERAWKVPSLGSDTGAAVGLFVERATSAGCRGLSEAPALEAIADIVRQLDGVPLAIELAAARTRSMNVMEIHERLDDRFRILSGGKRRSRQRQATLEAAVQWSYDLLDDVEQLALQQLAVFQGGFDPHDAAPVLEVDDATVIDLVDALVAKSLVDVTYDARGSMRHRLLETIRLFGLARLVETASADVVRDRHLEHFADDRVMRSMGTWLALPALERIDREYENFWAAAEWAIERDRPDAAAKIGACLSDAATARGDLETVLGWMSLPSAIAGRDAVFVSALRGHALNIAGRPDEALVFLADTVETGDALGCDDGVFAALDVATAQSIIDGDIAAQLRHLQRILQRSRERFGDSIITEMVELFTVVVLATFGEYDSILAMSAQGLTRNDFGYVHIREAWHAYALLQLGRVEEAASCVTMFTPVPPSSQWAMMNVGVEHVVMGATNGSGYALRALAPTAAEHVARRPSIAADLTIVFALLELRHGDRRLSDQAVNLTGFGVGALMIDLVLERDALSPSREMRARLVAEEGHRIPFAQRFENNRTMAPQLLAEAIKRWS